MDFTWKGGVVFSLGLFNCCCRFFLVEDSFCCIGCCLFWLAGLFIGDGWGGGKREISDLNSLENKNSKREKFKLLAEDFFLPFLCD